jgi:hypothetical protein
MHVCFYKEAVITNTKGYSFYADVRNTALPDTVQRWKSWVTFLNLRRVTAVLVHVIPLFSPHINSGISARKRPVISPITHQTRSSLYKIRRYVTYSFGTTSLYNMNINHNQYKCAIDASFIKYNLNLHYLPSNTAVPWCLMRLFYGLRTAVG